MDHIRNLLPATESLNPAMNGEWDGAQGLSRNPVESLLKKPPPTSGISLYEARNPRPIDGTDLDFALQEISDGYGVNAYEEDSAEFRRVSQIVRFATEDGMTGDEFRARLTRLVKKQEWATWTTAHFFNQETPKLYPYAWYTERVNENRANSKAIAGYRVAGHDKPLWGWRHEVVDLLPLFVAEEAEPDKAERAWKQANAEARGMTEEVQKSLDIVKENLELRDTVRRLQADNDALRTELKNWKSIAEYRDLSEEGKREYAEREYEAGGVV